MFTKSNTLNLHIDIGSRLKQHRQQKGLSQRALARLAGVTNGLISQIEQNTSVPRLCENPRRVSLSSQLLHHQRRNNARPFYDRRQLPNPAAGTSRSSGRRQRRHRAALSVCGDPYRPGADTQMYTQVKGGGVVCGRDRKSPWRASSGARAPATLLFRALPHRSEYRNPARASAYRANHRQTSSCSRFPEKHGIAGGTTRLQLMQPRPRRRVPYDRACPS